ASAATSDTSRIWLPEFVERFAASLRPNEVACALRLVNKATAAQFCAPQQTTVRLSQPVPRHAFAWRWGGTDSMRALARQQRLELLRLTARSGSVANLEVLIGRDDSTPVLDYGVFRAAAAAGQLDVCVWLRQRGCPWHKGIWAAASGGGQQAVCEWLLANGCLKVDNHRRATAAAARGGHVGLMDWLLLRADSTWVVAAAVLPRAAAEGCNLDTLQRLHHTHVDTLPGGLLQRGYPLGNYVAASAAGAGNMAALQYVLGQGSGVDDDMMVTAAEGGHIAVMEVLRVRCAPMDEETVRTAAAAGHLQAVAWLVERLGADRALKTDVFAAAAQAGSMELLGWLRVWGCPWDATVFAAGAEGGSEEQLEWLVEQGCLMGRGPPLQRSMGSHRARKRQRARPPASPPQQLQQQAIGPAACSDRVWLPELVQRFAASLQPNEGVCTLRLVTKATAAQFRGPQHITVRLSQPVPHHAFAWRWAGPDAVRNLARRQRLELPRLTARSGSIANLEVLLARDDWPPVLSYDVFRAAAAAGQLDMCVWLRQQDCPWRKGILAAAAGGGHKAVCERLLANGCPKVDNHWGATAAAARGGHVGLMDWLLLRADSTNVPQLLAGAAEGCDLPTLQRLHDTHVDALPGGLPAPYKPSTLSAAAGSPTADWQAKVEWLEARGYPQTAEACEKAAARPDALPRLQWLRQRGYPLNMGVALRAAEAGNMEALQHVLGQGVEIDDDMMAGAALGGHVAVMEVMHARGVPMGEETVRTAAAAGHLPAVAWLVERLAADTALTADVFAAAAQAGSMELLRWLRARGCAWDETVLAAGAEGGSEEQLEWLVEQGCPMGDDGEPYVRAARHGDLAMLRCLRRLGCPWGSGGSTLARAVEGFPGNSYNSGGILEHVLSWLLDQGCPVDWDAAEAAAEDKDDEELMGWLQEQRNQRAQIGSAAALLASMEPQRAQERQRPWPLAPPPPPQHDTAASASSSDPSRVWLPEFVERFAVSLMPNEVACALRLVNKATAAQLSAPQHTTVRLSQPVPRHAFAWCWGGTDSMRALARQQRLELQRLTARSGSVANLEMLLARGDLPPVLDYGVFRAAAAAGQLDVCVWLWQWGHPWHVEIMVAAAGGGHKAVCEWLLANGCPNVENHWVATAAAARGGHLGLMDWLLLRADGTHKSNSVTAVVRGAAEGCDLPTLQRLHHTHVDTLSEGLSAWYINFIITAAASSRTADWQAKVEWLEARGYPQTAEACMAAAAKLDALPRLQWLRQRGYPLGNYVAASAAEAGNMEALQYVLDEGVEVPMDDDMMRCAARGGHVAVMELLHARGAPMGEETVGAAAAAGHLPAVAWLVERLGADRALTKDVFAAAARAGSMELLGWLRVRGCPWDATVFTAGAAGGSEEQLEWLVEQGCLMGDDGEPYVRAARNGDLAMLRCLRRLGCPWGPGGSTFTRAVAGLINEIWDYVEPVEHVLSFLLDGGCPVDWDAAEAAAEDARDKARTGWLQMQRKERAHIGSGGLP
ncbi:Ankyrin repeat domain-containing protein, partial [Tetrabaena socialis]